MAVVASGLILACGDGSTGGSSKSPPPPLAASGFFESDGLQIHYESFGEGDPIILVHGWGEELYSYSVMARDVLNLMDHFGIEKADLMGYSLGSFSGAYLLGHHTDRFRSMILAGIGDETDASIAEAPLIAAALRADGPADITEPIGLGWRQFVDGDPRNDREALAVAALQMWPEGFPLELGGPGLA